MRTIHLYGAAADAYGASFRMDVSTAQEAVFALSSQLPGFRQFLVTNNFEIVRGSSLEDGLRLDEEALDLRLGNEDLHVMPVLEGAGEGAAKAIGGVALAAGAFFAAPMLGMFAGSAMMMGVGMAATGVSQMLSAQGKDLPENPSFGFSGTIVTAQQGMVVPLAWGRVNIRASRVISAGISAEDIAL